MINMEIRGTLAEYFKQEVDLNRLINILISIEGDNIDVITQNGIIIEIHGDNKEVVLAWVLAEELLITEDGECNWRNIDKLKQRGFEVFAGHNSGTGWITGCIKTKRGILVYG